MNAKIIEDYLCFESSFESHIREKSESWSNGIPMDEVSISINDKDYV